MRNKEEAKLQTNCFRWFDYQYPDLKMLLFAVPNGGSRNVIEAANLKAQGVRAGVSDVIFLYPTEKYPFLCIEFKSKTGKQTQKQIEFQKQVEKIGGRYEIVRNFEQFVENINNWVLLY